MLLMRTALVHLTGPAHLLNFDATFHWRVTNGHTPPDRIIFLHVQMQKMALQSLTDITNSLRKHLFESSDFLHTNIPLGTKNSVSSSIVEAIPSDIEVNELWLSKIDGASDQALMDAFPAAAVFFFSEGLSFARHVLAQNRIWRRVSAASSGLATLNVSGNRPGKKTLDLIPKNISERTLQRGAEWLELKHPPMPSPPMGEGPLAVVFGKALYAFGDCSYEDELAHHVNLCAALAIDGYQVLWVEHPRAPAPYHKAASFKKLIDSGKVLCNSVLQGVPFEIIAASIKIDLSVSLGSTAQLSLKEWHEVPGVISTDLRLQALRNRPAIKFISTILPSRWIDDSGAKRLGLLDGSTVDPYGAEQCLRESLTLDPKNQCLYKQLSEFLISKDRQPEAINILAKGTSKIPNSAHMHLLEGALLCQAGDTQAGLRSLAIAERTSATDPYVLHRLAFYYAQAEEHTEALRCANMSVKLDPGEAGYRRLRNHLRVLWFIRTAKTVLKRIFRRPK